MNQDRYLTEHPDDEIERKRLEQQTSYLDPITVRHFEAVGVSEGWKCLEVGAGTGSMAKWLANRVGPAGKIIAADINTRFLKNLDLPNIEVRQHDILKDEIQKDNFDLVHCRALLMWLPEPEKALERMLYAVRPGGWLLVEEGDFGWVMACDQASPDAEVFNRTNRALYDVLRKNGPLEPYFGRQLRRFVDKLRLNEYGYDGNTLVVRGGEDRARVQGMGLKTREKALVAAGVFTQAQHDTVQRLLLDPSFYFCAGTLFSIWGRKPANHVN